MNNNCNRKIIISVAPVSHTAKIVPAKCHNPLTPEQVAEETISCAKAGASMVHLHVRDSQGEQTANLSDFSKTIDLIRDSADIIIQGSTGGLSTLSLEERCVALNDSRVELASLNMGSVNFGEDVYINTLPDIRFWAEKMTHNHIHPELEIFDLSMIHSSLKLANLGIISVPTHFNFCLGVENAIPATADNVYILKSSLPDQSKWGIVHDNMKDFTLLAAALALGASVVRVGFEDSFYYAPDKIATSNIELVKQLVHLIDILGFVIATPKEARQILNLKPLY